MSGRGVPGPKAMDPVERILQRVTVDDNGCWVFTGTLGYGYGQIVVGSRRDGSRRSVKTHRFMYEAKVGPIPEGLDLDHLCRNRACCNPEHLEAVTRRVNLLRGETHPARNAAKTHCPQGHPYAGSNLGRDGDHRICRTCKADYQRRLRAARRQA